MKGVEERKPEKLNPPAFLFLYLVRICYFIILKFQVMYLILLLQ